MPPRMLLLLMLDVWDESMRGRTVVQKCAYFLSQVTGEELGFRPHFYGPFSPVVERCISDLCGLGFVEERVTRVSGDFGGGRARLRYDYDVTSDGESVAKSLYGDSSEVDVARDAVRRIKSAGGHLRAAPLSVAAKTHFILLAEGSSMTTQGVVKHAAKLNWDIRECDVSAAVEFLADLDLVRRVNRAT